MGMVASNTQRIMKEIEELRNDPPKNITAGPVDASNIYTWKAVIYGPPDRPYEGGFFEVDISISDKYPMAAPKMVFKSKIYHCNVNSFGAICLSILKDGWSPALTISTTLLSISSLLTEPNPDDPYVADIAKLLVTNKKKHDEIARQWTLDYARHEKLKF